MKGIVFGIILLFLGMNIVPVVNIVTAEEVWHVTIQCNTSGGQGDYVTFGEATDAHDGPPVDAYDVVKPPAGVTPYIRTWFNDNLPSPYDVLFSDYRQYPATLKVWNLTLQWMPSSGSSPTTVTLLWVPSDVDDSEYTSVDFCSETGAVLKNMLLYSTYAFSCPAYVPQNFKIICNAAGNSPPVANPDSYSLNEDTTLTVMAPGVLGNDDDFDNDSLTAIKVTDPSHGSVTLNANGGFTYVPVLNYKGPDSFLYKANDGFADSSNALVSINVISVNDPPVVTDIPGQTIAEGALFATIILDNYVSDVDHTDAQMTWTYSGNTQLTVSVVNRVATISVPNPDWYGSETITLKATDPGGLWDDDPVTLTVTTAENDPPVFGTPTPTNRSINHPLSFVWSIPINDPESDRISWAIQCSNRQITSGSGATNGTKTLALSGLAYSTTYKVWVNATDPTGSNTYTRRWYTFTTKANLPLVFGAPSPANGSTGNLLSLSWSIPINDPEGNLFSWTIQCSNEQTNSGSGATNGTKTLALSGLAYSTTYTVWVNATDPTGSNTYTRRWYSFTTKANLPPVFGTSSPANGSTGNPLSLSWSIPINDPEGNLFSWTIQCSNEQTNSGSGATNGTKTLALSGLAYSTMYTVWVNATDPTGSTTYTRKWYVFTTGQVNHPPNTPSALYPSNGSTGISVNADFSWNGGDPDPGDSVTYDVYFGTSSPPPKKVNNQTTTSYDPGTMGYSTRYYWKIIVWDSHDDSTTTVLLQFTTAAHPGGGGSGEPPLPPQNIKPVADASAGESFQGFINSAITLNGSKSYDPDGNLTKWFWDFGDGSNGSGEITTHIYQEIGLYNVILIVTDDKNATGTDTITIQILPANQPPTTPEIYGTRLGAKNQTYLYTIRSTDPENDSLQYLITWGDDTQNTSDFQPSGTPCFFSHTWDVPGKYLITAIATDKTNQSEQATFSVFIDAYFIGELGFLFDKNNDGLYDSLYTNVTGLITNVQRLTNGSYLLDTDNDGTWNYLYNPSLNSLTKIDNAVTTLEDQWVFFAVIILAVVIIGCIVYLYKKDYF